MKQSATVLGKVFDIRQIYIRKIKLNSCIYEFTKYLLLGNGVCSDADQVNESSGNFTQRKAATNKLVYWGESHDTYCNDGGESKNISQNNIDRAYAVVAGNNGATALYFSRPFEKAKSSIKVGVKGSTHFKDREVAAVNHLFIICKVSVWMPTTMVWSSAMAESMCSKWYLI